MSRLKLQSAFILITAIIVFIMWNSASSADNPLHTLSGNVIQSEGIPLAGVAVSLFSTEYADTTDSSGLFEINNVPAGNYIMTITGAGQGLENVHNRITVPYKSENGLEITVRKLTYQADEVVVLLNRERDSQEFEKLPSHVTVVPRAEFENNSTTVADVISKTPGAYISSMGGLGDYSEISLRGSYSNQVNVYIDGMLLNEALGGSVNLGTIPLTQVENVEVWRSGAPAEFGGDSAGGVINIKTRNMSTGQNTVSLGYGSFNTLTAGGVVNIPLGMSKFHITVDHSSSDNDFEYGSDNGTMYNKDDDYTARRNNDEYRSTNLMSKFSHIFEGGVLLELSEHILSGKKNIPGKDNKRYSDASLETQKNLFQAKVSLKPFLYDILDFEPRFNHIFSREHYRDKSGTVGWGFQDNIYNTNTFNVIAPLSLKLGRQIILNMSAQAKHESFSPDFKLENFAPLSSDREQLGILLDTFYTTSGERLTVTANARRERLFSSFEGQPSSFNRTTPESEFHHLTNSQIGLKFALNSRMTLKANYGDIKRAPSLYELFGDRGNTLSNPELLPEHTHRWDTGSTLKFGTSNSQLNGTLELAYFENSYKNLIQWYTDDGGFVTPDNVGGSYVKGIETVWNTRIFQNLSFSGNWSAQQSKVTKEDRIFFRNKHLPNRPGNYGNLKLEYPFKRLSFFWLMNSKSSYFLDRANQDYKRYPGRTLNDIGFSFHVMNNKSVVSVIAKNIADVRTFDIQGMPKPGRSLMITCVYNLN
ncbi:TonB-dependent receptor domain-containing protein [Candidatus Latescibacterota bacterium]